LNGLPTALLREAAVVPPPVHRRAGHARPACRQE